MHYNWYKTAQEVFRGDTSPINIEDYDPEYGIRELGKSQGASAAWGPGIYFTNQEDIAEMYGSNITKKFLYNANILTNQSPLFSYQQIKKMIMEVDKATIDMAVSNWDENYKNGLKILIQNIVNADSPLDQLMNIWADVFSHQNSNAFIELMIKNGIDGISIQKDDAIYYVIYNRSILK